MNHLELYNANLHNRHIRFSHDGVIHTGVVVDDSFHKEGKTKRTDYTFIHTAKLREWKEAEKIGDRSKMDALSSIVDISKITWGEPYRR